MGRFSWEPLAPGVRGRTHCSTSFFLTLSKECQSFVLRSGRPRPGILGQKVCRQKREICLNFANRATSNRSGKRSSCMAIVVVIDDLGRNLR